MLLHPLVNLATRPTCQGRAAECLPREAVEEAVAIATLLDSLKALRWGAPTATPPTARAGRVHYKRYCLH